MASRLEMGDKELRDRLLQFDRAVTVLYPGRQYRLVLVGGGAMVLLGCLVRSTDDLDALEFPAELVPLMKKYDLSTNVTAYMDQFAYNLEERLVPLDLETKSVKCYAASVEDIVASKLYSNRVTDETDIRRPELLAALDWDRLAEVVADMEGSKLIERRHREFLDSYEAYRKEHGPCDA